MILGIDYGRARLGLSLSEGDLAEPFATLERKAENTTVKEIREIVAAQNIQTIVIGISEGLMAKETRRWGEKLEKVLELPIEYIDETLTSVESGDEKKNDAKAAAIILQRYLDEKNKR